MKIVLCDITGRTINYDVALCEAIREKLNGNGKIEFWSSGINNTYPFKIHNFYSLVPLKYRSIAHPVTKVLKAFDTLFAYVWIIIRMLFTKVDILHLQWFPFISLGTKGASIDMFFIRLMKMVSPKTKYIFTIHNMCPHSMKEEQRQSYNPTFSKALKLFNCYVVHTENTKKEVVEVLGLDQKVVHVIYHGIFSPKDYVFRPIDISKGKLKIIMYGFQNAYKGTDILVQGLSLLPETYKEKIAVKICGAIDDDYLKKCRSLEKNVHIEWIPRFLSDLELNDEINNSDVIILPYRRISQSGVLLLALSTKRLIITSDLPTFKETLKGFSDNSFFESENPNDLARVLEDYLNGNIRVSDVQTAISKLREFYSWNASAKETLKMYS